ncbi:MAG: septal ring lytic transglycosylase RlpA family protein, partial [Treponema sp.]|nr:septal ring lytic transglycosylase RlpA family protein [Treponema sp.]
MKQLCGRFFTLLRNVVTLAAVLLSLGGASVWEGAAALAPRGDLPEDGYYAATNSFPPNTVVDITNLETGKSIRAIVAAGLNTPGLLAVLSPDAAGRIGLGTKAIGRIRMTQPEDPVAFARFTEGLVTSGDPDYDPEAMLAVDQWDQEEPGPVREQAESPQPAEIPPSSYEPMSLRDPDYAEYAQSSIVSLAGEAGDSAAPQGQIADEWEPDWDDLSYSAYLPGDDDSPEQTNYLIWEQGGNVGVPETPGPGAEWSESGAGDPLEPGDPSIPGDPWEEAWSVTDDSSGRLVAEARSSARSSGGESSAASRVLVQQPAPPAQPSAQEYILIPAEERPPAAGPSASPVVSSPAPAGPARQPSDRIDESLFIDSIEKVREERAGAAEEQRRAEAEEAARIAEEQRAAEEAARIAEEQRRAAEEAARIAEEQQAAEEAARLAEEQRRAAEEAARIAEEQRAAEEAARIAEEQRAAEPEPEVIVILPREAGTPQGPWLDSPPEALLPLPAEPEVLVRPPEEAGEPRGPWVGPLEPAREPPPEPPLEPPLITTAPPEPEKPEPDKAGPSFSIPVNVITEMEKGKYYVQLGAFRSAASVESALLRIDP